ncbi:hypothetical protein GCM10023169_10060 [Georgenia halophila]|uniref:DUF2267 domain-containing protein n=1 Tax=Georgenia halophila TaxID=620889 RepID=A0ABP8KZJ1_9MICO
MQHDEFIGQVQTRAKLASRGDAERATRATLETLGERVPEGLVENLAAELPVEIGENLRRTITFGGEGTGERFDRSEFVSRITDRTGADAPDAVFQARSVLEVVGDAVQGGLMDNVAAALPDDIKGFLGGRSGKLDDAAAGS